MLGALLSLFFFCIIGGAIYQTFLFPMVVLFENATGYRLVEFLVGLCAFLLSAEYMPPLAIACAGPLLVLYYTKHGNRRILHLALGYLLLALLSASGKHTTRPGGYGDCDEPMLIGHTPAYPYFRTSYRSA